MTFIKQDCAIAEHKLDVTVLIAINGIRLAVDCTKPGYTTKFRKKYGIVYETHARTHARPSSRPRPPPPRAHTHTTTTTKQQLNNNQTTTTKTELASSETSSFVEEKPYYYENETKCYKLFTCVFRLSSVPSIVV